MHDIRAMLATQWLLDPPQLCLLHNDIRAMLATQWIRARAIVASIGIAWVSSCDHFTASSSFSSLLNLFQLLPCSLILLHHSHSPSFSFIIEPSRSFAFFCFNSGIFCYLISFSSVGVHALSLKPMFPIHFHRQSFFLILYLSLSSFYVLSHPLTFSFML